MGSHITTVPNHQTKRTAILKTRFLVALWGTFGLELNLTKLTQEELEEVKEIISLRQRLCPICMFGLFYRLPGFTFPGGNHSSSAGITNGSADAYAWMFVSPDSTKILSRNYPVSSKT